MATFKSYEDRTTRIALPLISEMGLTLWDVEFLKEGSDHYLRIYIDKEGGVDINECEELSRKVSDILDREDFIDQEYIFEVSSPGLTRPLRRENDFKNSIGRMVELHTYAPHSGNKEFIGTLQSYDADTVTIEHDDRDDTFNRKDLSLIRLYAEF